MNNAVIKLGDMIECDNGYFFSASNMNILLYADKKTKKMEVILHFDGYPKWYNNLHSKVEIYNNKLFFFPKAAKGIHIYDMNTKIHKYIAFDESHIVEDLYYEPFRVRNTIWIISRKLGLSVIRYEMETEEIFYENEIADAIAVMVNIGEKRTYFGDSVKGNKIYIGVFNTNHILELDVTNKSVRKIELHRTIRLRNVFTDNNHLWITEVDKNVVCKCDLETEKMLCYSYDGSDKRPICFSKMIMADKKIYIINIYDRCIYKMDEEDEKVIRMDYGLKESEGILSVNGCVNFCVYDGNSTVTYALSNDINVYRYLTDTGVYEEIFFETSNIRSYLLDIMNEKINYMYNQEQIISETKDEFDLEFFIEFIKDIENGCGENKEIGHLILDEIKKGKNNIC